MEKLKKKCIFPDVQKLGMESMFGRIVVNTFKDIQ